MKKIILLFLLFACFFAKAQLINKAEYFIDTDPGNGNGVDIAVVTPGPSVNLNFAVPTTTLADGFHTLFTRTRLADGVWSLTEGRTFWVSILESGTVDIAAAEYFIDTDPGQGNALALNIGSSGSTVSFSGVIPTTGLTTGFHTLSIRVKNSAGIWSLTEARTFWLSVFDGATNDVVAAEYFIDTDPGQSMGAALNIGSSGSTVSFSSVIPTTGLTAGFHTLSIRAKNSAGVWSLTEARTFWLSVFDGPSNDIVAAEYFIDTDPGQGNALTLNVGATGGTVNFTAAIPTNTLSNGFHSLFIRVKNSAGVWGIFENRPFYISDQGLPAADIIAMEYFIDTDPGLGNGTDVAITPGNPVTLVANLPTGTLSAGKHFLYLRAKSTDGWGLSEKKEFMVGAVVIVNKPLIMSVDNKTPSPILTNVNKPVFKGTAEPNLTISVFNGINLLGTTIADATGNWSFTPATALSDGTLNITTKAKNASNAESDASDVFVVVIDTQIPNVPVIASVDAKTTQNFTTTNNKPIIVGTAENLSTVELFNGATSLGTVNTNATGNFTFTPSSALPDGNYVLTAKAKDAAGNISVGSASFGFKIKNVSPNAPLIVSVDAKTTQNFTTTNNKPIIVGTAENLSTVELFNGATSLGTVTANATGNFTFTPSSALPDGNYVLTAKAKDGAGNISVASASFSFKIDNVAPNAPVIVSVDAKTTQNFTTTNNKPIIVGTAENLSTVELFNGATSLGNVTANATGNFTFTPSSALPDGNYILTAKAKDGAGNISVASASFSFKIDNVAPSAPVIVSADGKTTQNFTTTNNKPAIVGTAENLSTVEVFNGATSLGTVTANAAGNFTFTPSSALPDGNYILTAKAKDGAGNISVASASFSFKVDNVAPNAPVIVSVDGKNVSPTMGINRRPILTGTAEPGSTVKIFANNNLMGTTITNTSGNWLFTQSSELAFGVYNFTATAMIANGNESAKGAVFIYELIAVNAALNANNVLTPNGDGKNDFLVVNNLQNYPNSNIRIFDRAGRIVFTANAYQNDWGGVLNGTILAEGTYYYVIELGGGYQAFKSFITIVRKSIR